MNGSSLTLKQIEKAIEKSTKTTIAASGIHTATRSGNKELSHLIKRVASQLNSLAAAQSFGEALGNRIIALSQQTGRQNLDQSVIRQLSRLKQLPNPADYAAVASPVTQTATQSRSTAIGSASPAESLHAKPAETESFAAEPSGTEREAISNRSSIESSADILNDDQLNLESDADNDLTVEGLVDLQSQDTAALSVNGKMESEEADEELIAESEDAALEDEELEDEEFDEESDDEELDEEFEDEEELEDEEFEDEEFDEESDDEELDEEFEDEEELEDEDELEEDTIEAQVDLPVLSTIDSSVDSSVDSDELAAQTPDELEDNDMLTDSIAAALTDPIDQIAADATNLEADKAVGTDKAVGETLDAADAADAVDPEPAEPAEEPETTGKAIGLPVS